MIVPDYSCSMLYAKTDEVNDGAVVTTSLWHRITVEEANSLRVGVPCLQRINVTRMGWRKIEITANVRQMVEHIENYKHVRNREKSASTSMYCTQSNHHSVKLDTSDKKETSADNRHSESKRLECCYRSLIRFKMNKHQIFVRFFHGKSSVSFIR